MDNKSSLPNGFITIEEAVKLIESDSRTDAKVDIKWLAKHLDMIGRFPTFRIPLARTATKEEIMEQLNSKKYRGRPSPIISMGSVYVATDRAYYAETLKECIRNHYKKMSGKEFAESSVRAVSSVADEEKTGGNVQPRIETPIAKEGETIGDAKHITTNGENL